MLHPPQALGSSPCPRLQPTAGFLKSAPKNMYLKTCPANFSQSTGCLISALYPELLSGVVESQQL